MSLPAFSVRRRVTTLMFFCAAVLLGVFTLVQVPLDLFPRTDIPVITVSTAYPGASPEEVEQGVTRPLEQAFSVIEDVTGILSVSREGVSIVRVNFEWGVNLDARASDIRDAIENTARRLPEDAERSQLRKFDLSQVPVLMYGVQAGESLEDLETILDELVVRPLESVPGVAAVQRFVPPVRQLNVDLDLEALIARDLAPGEVAAAISREDREVSAGSVKSGFLDYLARVPMRFEGVGEIENLVVVSRHGEIVRLGEVGRVERGFREKTSHILINNQPGAMIMITKQADANTVQVADRVKSRLDGLLETLPPDVSLAEVFDSSEDIRLLVSNLLATLLLGGALAVLAVLVFLRRARATAIIALSMPFSLLGAGIVIYLLGYSLNVMTLFALIVCIGLVVDNSIVILENVTRHREEGEKADEGAIFGAGEVSMAITASTLTTVCIFLPLFFVRGLVRIFFEPFAIIASVVILASLFSALTVTPMFSSWLLGADFRRGTRNVFFRLTERVLESLSEAYASVLEAALARRGAVILAAAVLFLAGFALVPRIGFEFMPREDRGSISGSAVLPPGTRLEKTIEAAAEINRIIEETVPPAERLQWYTSAGSGAGPPGARAATNAVDFGVRLVPVDRRESGVDEVAGRLRSEIEAIRGLHSIEEITVGTGDAMSGLMAGGRGRPLTVNIRGEDLEAAGRLAERIRLEMEAIPGAVDITSSIEETAPELWVRIDRERAQSLGLAMDSITRAVRDGLYGRVAGRFRERGREIDIFVRLREEDRLGPGLPGRLPVRRPGGGLVTVENIAEIVPARGPRQIERSDQQRIVRVEADVSGRSVGEAAREVGEMIRSLEVPLGMTVEVGGQAEEIRESFFWLTLALLMAVILVYMIMASQFESLRYPLVVMFSLPFTLTGVLWGLFLTGTNLSTIVFLGLLMLVGIVVNNAIVLVDYTNILRARGLPAARAIREAGRIRLRPVLMTSLTTIVALLPMALGSGQGRETWNPLGITIVSGLLLGTLVTLVLVPVIYSLLTPDPGPAAPDPGPECPAPGRETGGEKCSSC